MTTTTPSTFWSEALQVGAEYGVNPYLLSAISEHETEWGSLGAGRDGYSLGVGVYDTGDPNSNYQDTTGDYTKQLTWAAQSIAKNFSGDVTEQNIKNYQIVSGYATDSDWASGVWDAYQGLAVQTNLAKPAQATVAPQSLDQQVANTPTIYQTLTQGGGVQGLANNTASDVNALGFSSVTDFLNKLWSMNTVYIIGGSIAIMLIIVHMTTTSD